MLDFKKWKVRWDNEKYIPQKIYGFETEPKKATSREIAEGFLKDKENLQSLKISASEKDLKFDKVSESLGATTVLFQQHFEKPQSTAHG